MKKGLDLLAEHKKEVIQQQQELNQKIFNGPHKCYTQE